MAAWTCAACGTHNESDSGSCMVCGGEMRAREGAPGRRFEPLMPVPEPARRPRPGPGGSPAPARPSTGRRHSWVAVAVMILILLAAAALRFATTRSGDAGQSTTQPAGPTTYDGTTTSPTPETTTTTAEPTAGPAGLVAIEQYGDLAEEVAAMFETYFGGINARDPVQALSVVVPTNRLDPSKPKDVADFSRAIATTRDEDIRLGAVRDDGSTVTAELTFRSRQDSGYGPTGSPGETCTDWTMHYTLADDSNGLRIKGVDPGHRSC